jgi:hypothetical protein
LEDTDVVYTVDKTGKIEKERKNPHTLHYTNENMENILKDNEIEGVSAYTLREACEEYIGQPFSAYLTYIKSKSRNARQRSQDARKAREWMWVPEIDETPSVIEGIDEWSLKETKDRISVVLLLNEEISYHQQRDYLFDHYEDWLPGIIQEIKDLYPSLEDVIRKYKLYKLSISYYNKALVTFERR